MSVSPPEPAPPKLLIVEDEVLIGIHLSMLLGSAGFEVTGVAPDAAQAYDLAAAAPPCAAVVDIRLGPGPDGIVVAERLRQLYGCCILFISGSAERATRERAEGIPGAVFLQKPVDPESVVRWLRRMLGN